MDQAEHLQRRDNFAHRLRTHTLSSSKAGNSSRTLTFKSHKNRNLRRRQVLAASMLAHTLLKRSMDRANLGGKCSSQPFFCGCLLPAHIHNISYMKVTCKGFLYIYMMANRRMSGTKREATRSV